MALLNSLTSGKYNTSVGKGSLYSASTLLNNTSMGSSCLSNCTGSNNTALGSTAGSSITTGSGNICLGIGSASGQYDNTVSDNIYIGNGTSTTASGVLGGIILGNNASCSMSNQLSLGSTITSFNFPGLTSSTGSGEGTILEYDSLKNILPSSGTYNSISKIDTAITAIQNSIPKFFFLYSREFSSIIAAAQNSGLNTEIFLPAGDYTLSTLATFTSAAGQNIIDCPKRVWRWWYWIINFIFISK